MEINEKITDTEVSEPVTENDGHATEPTVEDSEPKTSLEFEIAEEPGLVFMSETDVSFDDEGGLVFATEADVSPTVVEDATPADTPEESEPSVFDVIEDDGTSNTSFVTDSFGVNVTYVPRFTDVSENYRVRGASTPAPDTSKTAEPELDPTAEIGEDAVVERVVVGTSSARTAEPTDESVKVYKFDTPAEPEEEPIAPVSATEPTVEPTVEEPVTDTVPTFEPIPEPKVLKRPEEYDIPDPEARKSTVEYKDSEEDLSSGAAGKIKKEFISPAQRDAFKDRFLDTLMSIRFRLSVALLLLAAVVFTEVAPIFGFNPLDLLQIGGVGSAAILVDLAFSVCLFALALPETVRAFASLFKKVVAPELFCVISLSALVGYTVIVSTNGGGSMHFGILFGIQVVATIFARLQRTKGDFTAFKITSKNTHKHVLIKKLTRELLRENLALDGVVDEYSSKTARMFRTAFVNDFCAHSSKTVENNINVLLILGCALGLSLVTGVVSFFLFDNSIVYAAEAFVLVLLVACPASSILLHKLPYNAAARYASTEEIAFVGESALYDGADVDVIAYEDTEIFGEEDVSITKVHLYGKVINTAKAMKQMYAIFSGVGGPLDLLFTAAVDGKGPHATELVIEEDGISGLVDGHRIHAGSEEYMLRKGIAIPSDDYRTARTTTDSTRIMYGAEDGEVYVKFFIRYSFTEEFTMIIPYLKEQGIVPLIYTRDPNINNALLKNLTMGDDVIRVMKKDGGKTTEEKTYVHLSSNIVTLADRTTVVNIAQLSRKYTAFQSSLAVTELISMIVGAVLAVLVAVGGMLDAAKIGLVLGLAVWQLAWCVVLAIRSRLSFRISKSDKD